jgi:hypothetical protein
MLIPGDPCPHAEQRVFVRVPQTQHSSLLLSDIVLEVLLEKERAREMTRRESRGQGSEGVERLTVAGGGVLESSDSSASVNASI